MGEIIKTYHHDNLKKILLEQTIKIVSENGENDLSLRKLASICEVSHNAMYRHFNNKEDLLNQCRNYVTNEFTDYLTNSIKDMDKSDLNTVSILGYAYINFFRLNPSYFNFIYSNKSNNRIILTINKVENNYPPFEVFREICVVLTEKYGLSKEEGLRKLIKSWAVVQGVVSLIISENVSIDGEWKDNLINIFR